MEETKKHICGQCGEGFDTEDQYLDHKCAKTEYTPRDPEHQGESFKAISEAALARGEAKKKVKE